MNETLTQLIILMAFIPTVTLNTWAFPSYFKISSITLILHSFKLWNKVWSLSQIPILLRFLKFQILGSLNYIALSLFKRTSIKILDFLPLRFPSQTVNQIEHQINSELVICKCHYKMSTLIENYGLKNLGTN